MSSPPLDDVTVLDLSQGAAGPYASVLLADFGADVVAVEPPGGGNQRRLVRGSFRPNLLRNKRSVVLDLKADDADEIMRELIAEADVFLHNYRPSVMARLGYPYDSVRRINDRVVYCSVTGYGESGPYRDRPGFDPLAQAQSGLLWNTGEPDRKPSRVGASVIDLGTGVHAAFAVMVALWERARTGEGTRIETSLLDTAAAYMGYWYTDYSRTGETPRRQGHTWEGYAPVGAFETADDPVYLSVPFDYLWERFCRALGREEWLDDPRFATDDARTTHREELLSAIEAAFADYPRDELLELLLGAGVPVAELRTIAEAATDDHLRERGTVRAIPDTDGTERLAAVAPVLLGGSSPTVYRPPPPAGADTRAVLGALGFTDDDIGRFIAAGTVADGQE